MDGIAFLTPDYEDGAPILCRRLALPSFLWPLFNGAFGQLLESDNWHQFGDMVIDDVIQAFQTAFDEMRPCSMIGQIVSFFGRINENCLPLDGQNYRVSDYPELAASLPEEWVGKDFFNLPDADSLFLRGAGGFFGPGDQGGYSHVTLNVSNLPPHTHGYNEPLPNVDIEAPGAPDILAAGVGPIAQTTSTGNGEPFGIIPPFIAVNWAIVAK